MMAERCGKLPRWMRRLVAVFVVPALLLVIGAAIAVPILAASNAQAQWRNNAGEVIGLARHAQAAQADLDQRSAALRDSPLWSRLYAADASAGSPLHSDVSSLLAQVHTSAQSLTPIAARELPQLTRISVRCAASMRTDQLEQFIAAVARHSRYLRIERLVVSAPVMQVPEENPALAVTMDIVGFERRRSEDVPLQDMALAQQVGL